MPVNLKMVRAQLESERKHLILQLEQVKGSTRPSEEKRESTPFGKRDEGATETLALEKRLAMEKRINEQLAEVERALKKIDEGTYGLCELCRGPIEEARLEALPKATVCMACKNKPKPRQG